MKSRPMEPETIARRAREHAAERKASTRTLRDRLAAKAKAEGPDSIWAELLSDMDALKDRALNLKA